MFELAQMINYSKDLCQIQNLEALFLHFLSNFSGRMPTTLQLSELMTKLADALKAASLNPKAEAALRKIAQDFDDQLSGRKHLKLIKRDGHWVIDYQLPPEISEPLKLP